MTSQFEQITEAAAQVLRASAGIPAGVPVVAFRRGEIESEIERALGTLGAAIVVLPFEPVHAIDGAVPPFYDEAELLVHILENPVLNASGADGAALRDAAVLALTGDDLDGLLAEALSEHRIARADDEALTIREITWRTAVQMSA
jgi:hypothetical protein